MHRRRAQLKNRNKPNRRPLFTGNASCNNKHEKTIPPARRRLVKSFSILRKMKICTSKLVIQIQAKRKFTRIVLVVAEDIAMRSKKTAVRYIITSDTSNIVCLWTEIERFLHLRHDAVADPPPDHIVRRIIVLWYQLIGTTLYLRRSIRDVVTRRAAGNLVPSFLTRFPEFDQVRAFRLLKNPRDKKNRCLGRPHPRLIQSRLLGAKFCRPTDQIF